MEFKAFNKIPRLSREVVITEKIDGTNACIAIEAGQGFPSVCVVEYEGVPYTIHAGSRSRWIFPGKATDNAGFAGWVKENAPELVKLGEGMHYGEWWGKGIQRGYGLDEKRFSLFNVGRWIRQTEEETPFIVEPPYQYAPACCHVVPEIRVKGFSYPHMFQTSVIEIALMRLTESGSLAAPGFMKPEGIVIYHTASGHLYKKTIEGDEKPKGSTE